MEAFSYEKLGQVLRDLAVELANRNSFTQLHVGGGAAMLLEYDSFRRTLDVDCRIDGDVEKVLEVANLVGRRHGLDEGRLNQNMWMAWPQKSDEQATTVYADDHLVVTVASPEHLLAMKVRAGRQKDRHDICRLARFPQFSSAKQVWDLDDKVFEVYWRKEDRFLRTQKILRGLWPEDDSMDDDQRYQHGFAVARRLHDR